MSQTKKQNSLEVAEVMLDIVPATMRVIRHELRTFAKGEVTVPQLRVMAHLLRGTVTSAELSDLQGVSLVAISRMVEGLVEKGYVIRRFKKGNRKQIFFYCSEKGKRIYLKFRNLAKESLSNEIRRISFKDQTSIYEGLLALDRMLTHRRRSPVKRKKV